MVTLFSIQKEPKNLEIGARKQRDKIHDQSSLLFRFIQSNKQAQFPATNSLLYPFSISTISIIKSKKIMSRQVTSQF